MVTAFVTASAHAALVRRVKALRNSNFALHMLSLPHSLRPLAKAAGKYADIPDQEIEMLFVIYYTMQAVSKKRLLAFAESLSEEDRPCFEAVVGDLAKQRDWLVTEYSAQ